MWFWPGLDQWPPSKEVWVAAAVLAFVVTPILMLIGVVGQIILGIVIVACIAWSVNARLKYMNQRAEEFWESGPDD